MEIMKNNVNFVERIDIYDIAKGIGSILVIIGHLLIFFPGDSDVCIYIYIFIFHFLLYYLDV